MFIAHLPAGYVISSWLLRKLNNHRINAKVFVGCGMFGAIAPDLDILYFYVIDNMQRNHHAYFTHFPLIWLVMLASSTLWMMVSRTKSLPSMLTVFFLNGLAHMLLDTVVGAIQRLAPVSDQYFAFFKVPALYKPWWLNFVLHWSFLIETGILVYAVLQWRRKQDEQYV